MANAFGNASWRILIAVETSPTMLKYFGGGSGTTKGLSTTGQTGAGLGKVVDNSVDARFSYGLFVHLDARTKKENIVR